MVNFVADIQMSLTIDTLTSLVKLAESKKMSVEQCARECMEAKIKEELHTILFQKVEKKQEEFMAINTDRKQLELFDNLNNHCARHEVNKG